MKKLWVPSELRDLKARPFAEAIVAMDKRLQEAGSRVPRPDWVPYRGYAAQAIHLANIQTDRRLSAVIETADVKGALAACVAKAAEIRDVASRGDGRSQVTVDGLELLYRSQSVTPTANGLRGAGR